MAMDPFGLHRDAALDADAIEREVRRFLAEDVGAGDVTTSRVVPASARAHGAMVARQPCVVAGLLTGGLSYFRRLEKTFADVI
jgi:nicotinate-nucleotide pyrophosphorylase